LQGIQINRIYKGTPASKSKLVVGDVIKTVNGKVLTTENIISKNYGIRVLRNSIISLGLKNKGTYNNKRRLWRDFLQQQRFK
tara:strand:+ start:534 stop:779 length:246 start_codon:yes stop_codon:yes gene_type:complete